MSGRYILFHADGHSKEYTDVPEPVCLTDTLYWVVGEPKWYAVNIRRGTLQFEWVNIPDTDVPGGIRLLALLFS